jgi:hypothetical protein
MADQHSAADQVDGGAASLGDAQSTNPPPDPEYIEDDAAPLDADTDFHGEGQAPPAERPTPDDPAPNAP